MAAIMLKSLVLSGVSVLRDGQAVGVRLGFGYPAESLYLDFKKRFGEEWYAVATYTSLNMLADTIKRTQSTDPLTVAFAMEGARYSAPNGDVEIRATDHQLLQPLWISTWTKVGGANKHDIEKTGFTWKTEVAYPTYVASQPTSCNMKRPARAS